MSTHPLLLLLTLAICAFVSCDREAADSPAAPTPPPPLPASVFGTGPTRVIRIDGSGSFGDVEIGGSSAKEIPICNDGTAPVTVRGFTAPAGYSFGTPSYDLESVDPGRCMRAWGVFEPPALGPHAGTVTVLANQTSGNPTLQVSGTGTRPAVPRTVFGAGRYLVGMGVAPGRYFSNPDPECYWERTPTPAPAPGTHLTWRSSASDLDQWIVDILASDTVFETSDACGEWSRNPAPVRDPNVITPGIWLVRDQVPQGRYRASVRPGCAWARLRNFEGTTDAVSVIESGVNQSGDITVSIRSTDAGFEANEACGKWTRVS